MNDGIAIEEVDGGHDAFPELLFGRDADMAQHGAGQLGEEALDEVEPRAMLGSEGELEAACGLLGDRREARRSVGRDAEKLQIPAGGAPRSSDGARADASCGRQARGDDLSGRDAFCSCLTNRELPPTNNGSERAIRPCVIFRKVTYCFRSG